MLLLLFNLVFKMIFEIVVFGRLVSVLKMLCLVKMGFIVFMIFLIFFFEVSNIFIF